MASLGTRIRIKIFYWLAAPYLSIDPDYKTTYKKARMEMRTNLWSLKIGDDEYIYNNYSKCREEYLNAKRILGCENVSWGPCEVEGVELEDGTVVKKEVYSDD